MTPPRRAQNFASEWQRLIDARYNHPSIIMWVPFNEGWGQPDAAGTREVADWTAKLRSDAPRQQHIRLGGCRRGPRHRRAHVSGAFDARPRAHARRGAGRVRRARPADARSHLAGREELGLRELQEPRRSCRRAYRDRLAQLRLLVARGLSAAIYTQTTDVEIETNGLMTYDREVVKIPQATLADIHRTLYKDLPIVRTLLPTSELDGRAWRYTTAGPRRLWASAAFDDGAWQTGTAPFGGGKPEGVPLRTAWTSPADLAAPGVRLARRGRPTGCTWCSRTTRTPRSSSTASRRPACRNPRPATSSCRSGRAAAEALKTGRNVIAVRCSQTKGAQAIDVGIVRVQ